MAGSASAVEAPVEDSGRVWDFRRGVPFQLPRGWSFVDRLDEGEGECSTPLAVRQGLMTDHAQSSVTSTGYRFSGTVTAFTLSKNGGS